ncbi:hypothetical protein SAMN02745121_00383 [Nannocystis exedens]|uniref:Lipoprotein n=1 Tax=Nannocystis exedens TaxID=54 RepID=A0A1I1SZ58_9BACT|nr:hypothetical protein [Nannocystis exedens]PCC66889.1 hypothetical protein NAEX_09485 [Nannocystis exedens]SFD51735.1 hypothetical protein SAMN02745121_00383 [Nannocystis exedens]
MSRVALSLALALAWAPLAGCAVSASASTGSGAMSSGTGPQGKPARRVDEAGGEAGGGGAAPAGPPPCQPALADTPTALFGTRILVRMPKGVELAEQNPFYAQAVAPDQATSCGQPVAYAAVGFFEYPNAPVTAVRDQVLELRGIAKGTATWEDEGTRGKTYTGAYSAPADAATGAPAVRGWFVLRDANDKYGYFALYETDPAHWDALKPVLVASGKSLLVKPRSIASPVDAQVSAAPPAGGSAGGGLTAEPAGAKPAKPAKDVKAK